MRSESISIPVISCGRGWTYRRAVRALGFSDFPRPHQGRDDAPAQSDAGRRARQPSGRRFRDRPWNFCTPGFGHDARWWREFFVALDDIGYDDVASIENEDPYLPGIAGVERTVPFLRGVI